MRGRPGDTLSLIAFHRARFVSVSGVKWPLSGHTLEPGTLGVSNVFVEETVRIEVGAGILIAVHLRQEALPDWLAVGENAQ
jgi:thiamine pyrophosphokinase